MYDTFVRRMMRRGGSSNKNGARQWRRVYDDRTAQVVYQLKWRMPDGQWAYEERKWHRFEVLADPVGVRHRIAISLRIMRERLVRRVTGGHHDSH